MGSAALYRESRKSGLGEQHIKQHEKTQIPPWKTSSPIINERE